eukprot:m.113595 g.113595  ORF g.113595 m.113595 type:complete len:197 (+) comp17089_c0_seq2:274-864(+)
MTDKLTRECSTLFWTLHLVLITNIAKTCAQNENTEQGSLHGDFIYPAFILCTILTITLAIICNKKCCQHNFHRNITRTKSFAAKVKKKILKRRRRAVENKNKTVQSEEVKPEHESKIKKIEVISQEIRSGYQQQHHGDKPSIISGLHIADDGTDGGELYHRPSRPRRTVSPQKRPSSEEMEDGVVGFGFNVDGIVW